MAVGTPVAGNIDFCGYLRFFSIGFIWIIWVQYATDNLFGQQLELDSEASVDVSTHSELQCEQ